MTIEQSLLFDAPTVCKWCRTDIATTIIYNWPTCITCAVSRQVRVRRYLQGMNPYREKRP